MELRHTDFLDFAPAARARRQKRNFKMLDMEKAYRLIKENEGAKIHAGLAEDWGYTSGKIGIGYVDKYAPYCFSSIWATPALLINGEVIECWKEDDGTFNCFNDGEKWLEFCKQKGE